MTARWTNNSLSAGFYDENSQPDAFLSTESSVPSSPPCMADSAPQSSSTVSIPVAASVDNKVVKLFEFASLLSLALGCPFT